MVHSLISDPLDPLRYPHQPPRKQGHSTAPASLTASPSKAQGLSPIKRRAKKSLAQNSICLRIIGLWIVAARILLQNLLLLHEVRNWVIGGIRSGTSPRRRACQLMQKRKPGLDVPTALLGLPFELSIIPTLLFQLPT